MIPLVLGIDPGENGAWALITPDEILVAWGDLHGKHRQYRMPGKDKGAGLLLAIERFRRQIIHAVVEEGATRPKNSRGRVYKQGSNVGQVKGIAQGAGIPLSVVSASAWKAQLGVPSGETYQERKKLAREFAIQQWDWIRKARVDCMEAALLALWWVRSQSREGSNA